MSLLLGHAARALHVDQAKRLALILWRADELLQAAEPAIEIGLALCEEHARRGRVANIERVGRRPRPRASNDGRRAHAGRSEPLDVAQVDASEELGVVESDRLIERDRGG